MTRRRSLNKYSFNAFFVPDIFLGTRDTAIDQSLFLHEAYMLGKEQKAGLISRLVTRATQKSKST